MNGSLRLLRVADNALRAFYYREELEQPVLRDGVAMRYHEEVLIDGATAAGLLPGVDKGYVRPWF